MGGGLGWWWWPSQGCMVQRCLSRSSRAHPSLRSVYIAPAEPTSSAWCDLPGLQGTGLWARFSSVQLQGPCLVGRRGIDCQLQNRFSRGFSHWALEAHLFSFVSGPMISVQNNRIQVGNGELTREKKTMVKVRQLGPWEPHTGPVKITYRGSRSLATSRQPLSWLGSSWVATVVSSFCHRPSDSFLNTTEDPA
jgi:hypothetical protein